MMVTLLCSVYAVYCDDESHMEDEISPIEETHHPEETALDDQHETTFCDASVNEDPEKSGIPYELKFKGEIPDELVEQFRHVSLLMRLKDRLPNSYTGLGKRADQDKKKFRQVLASNGYFGGKVSFRISGKPDKAIVKFSIVTGNRYKILSLHIRETDNPRFFQDMAPQHLQDIMLIAPDQFVDIKAIQDSVRFLRRHMQENGYPFVQIDEPEGYVNHEKEGLELYYDIQTGPLAVMTATAIEGLKTIDPVFVSNRFQWKKDDVYSIKIIEKTNTELANTQLIANAEIVPSVVDYRPCVLDEERNPVPQPIHLVARVTEAAPRYIGVGMKYATSEGIGGHFFWHHNNVFGNQEHFGTSIKYSKRLKRIKLTYDLHDFGAPLQELNSHCFIRRELQRAYRGDTLGVSSVIRRPLMDMMQLKGHVGVSMEKAKLKQGDNTHPHTLIGFPLGITFNTTDSRLDPASGVRATVTFTPYTGKLEGAKTLGILSTQCMGYLPLSKTETGAPLFVLAGFFRYGSMFLNQNAFAPLNKRFYGGGADSIRAYAYQMLGPLDENRYPIGGRSKIELGSEVRFRIDQDWGCVLFYEGGIVSPDKLPSMRQGRDQLFTGYGVGLRYFTSFAPIRVDLALPNKKRHVGGRTVDAPFQLYISVGQAY
ncbi:MAG: BamA/TamA family outer membrane protein [Alphaproteobacteria bacterium]|nr:BamA/TamA family outer membrane protein [Alphaproteobacteria bacterium]